MLEKWKVILCTLMREQSSSKEGFSCALVQFSQVYTSAMWPENSSLPSWSGSVDLFWSFAKSFCHRIGVLLLMNPVLIGDAERKIRGTKHTSAHEQLLLVSIWIKCWCQAWWWFQWVSSITMLVDLVWKHFVNRVYWTVLVLFQVRVKPTKATKSPEKSMEGLMDLRNLKSIRKDNKLQRIEGAFSAPSSPRPSRWKQFLGAKGTVNPSLQNSPEKEEFQIDLNRFSSACSSIAKTTPCFKDMKGRTHTGAFLAKSLMMLQLDCEEREEGKELKHSIYEGSDNKVKDSETVEQGSFCKPVVNNILAKGAIVEEPLWKRRSGAKPLTLDLKKQSSHDRWRSEPHLEISIIILIFDLKTRKHPSTRFLVAWTKQALRILSYLKDLLVGRPFEQKGDLHDDELAHRADELREFSKWGLFQQLFQGWSHADRKLRASILGFYEIWHQIRHDGVESLLYQNVI